MRFSHDSISKNFSGDKKLEQLIDELKTGPPVLMRYEGTLKMDILGKFLTNRNGFGKRRKQNGNHSKKIDEHLRVFILVPKLLAGATSQNKFLKVKNEKGESCLVLRRFVTRKKNYIVTC